MSYKKRNRAIDSNQLERSDAAADARAVAAAVHLRSDTNAFARAVAGAVHFTASVGSTDSRSDAPPDIRADAFSEF